MPLSMERVAVTGATRDFLTPLGLPAPVLDDWARYAPPQVRTLLVARDERGVAGASLLTARPLAAYLKVAGLWARDDSAAVARALVTAAEETAWAAGHVVVKREDRPGWPDATAGFFQAAAGYRPVPAPAVGAPIPDPGPAVRGAWFNWRVPPPATAVPYLRQTTEFTCGTASLSMLLAGRGLLPEPSRQAELALWREATTVMACDPFGLAVTARRQGLAPRVVTSTRATLFTEDLTSAQERELREFIQDGFRAEAEAAGLVAGTREFDIAELRGVLAAGGAAIVLVDTLLVTGEQCPHWILVHGLLPDGSGGEWFLVHDPWTEWAQGESWVDAYDVPLSAEALNRLAWTAGSPPARAMLTFAR